MSELPPHVKARAEALHRLADGTLPPDARAALESEAEKDDDLAYALTLFAPLDPEELAAVHDRVQARLPAAPDRPALAVVDGERKGPAPGRLSGRFVVGAFAAMAAAAAILIAVTTMIQKAAFDVTGPANPRAGAEQTVRFELRPLRGEQSEATVLAVSGDRVGRSQVPLRKEGDRLVAEAPASAFTAGLAGPVEILFLAPTEEEGDLAPGEVRSMIAAFGDRAAAKLLVQPPAYAMAVAAEGTLRGGDTEPEVAPSTTVEVPGRVTFNLRPHTRTGGALALHLFVVRGDAAPTRLDVDPETRNGAFRLHVPSADLMGDAKTARVHLVVGPAGEPVGPEDLGDLGPPWRHQIHDLSRAR